MSRRIAAALLALLSGITGVFGCLVLLALDFDSWATAAEAGAAFPAGPILARFVLHGAALAFSMLSLITAVIVMRRPTRAGLLLLVAAVIMLPLNDFFIRLNTRNGLPAPVIVPSFMLLAATLLAFWAGSGNRHESRISSLPEPEDSHTVTS